MQEQVKPYLSQIKDRLEQLIQPKTKYKTAELRDILESVYFEVLPLKLAKRQKIALPFLLNNRLVVRSNGNFVKPKQAVMSNAFKCTDNIDEDGSAVSDDAVTIRNTKQVEEIKQVMLEEVVICRNPPTIKSISDLLFDLIEAFQNGDIRVKAVDYLAAIKELALLNGVQGTAPVQPQTIRYVLDY